DRERDRLGGRSELVHDGSRRRPRARRVERGDRPALQHGDPAGSVWRPGETDTSIRPGWFHHPAEDDKVKSVAALTEIYFNSVGRNSKLLLNVPPTRDGVLHDNDVARLASWHDRLAALFAEDFAAGRRPTQHITSPRSAVVEVDLGRRVTAGLVR